MQLVTVGPEKKSGEALVSACQEAAQGLAEALRLIVLYAPFGRDHTELVRALSHTLGVPVVGGTTGGVAFTERGYDPDGFVVGLLAGDALEVRLSVAPRLAESGAGAYADALRQLDVGSARRVSVMTFADPFTCDGEQVITAFGELRVPHARLFGGTVGDGWRLEGVAHVFANDQVLSDAAVFAAICSTENVEVQVLHGFRIADGAKPLVITNVEGARLVALNDMPAAEAYSQELKRLGLWDGVSDFHKTAALYELGAVTPFGEGLKIRVPISFADKGVMILGASLRKGETLRVVRASPDQLIGAAKALSSKIRAKQADRDGGAFVFDCAARWQLLGARYGEQVKAFVGNQGGAVLGTTGYGEIAKSGASIEGFHNTTAVMAGW